MDPMLKLLREFINQTGFAVWAAILSNLVHDHDPVFFILDIFSANNFISGGGGVVLGRA
jgi:hypothetical protein